MDIPITQSEDWHHLQQQLGETSFLEKGSNFQYLAILKRTPAGNYLYLPYGPVYEGEEGYKNALDSLYQLANHHQALFIRIEPTDPNFQPSHNATKTKDLSPKDTWILSLTPDREAIIAGFQHSLRATYRNFAKKGLCIEITKDPAAIDHLVYLQNKLYDRKHLSAFSEQYLKSELEQPFASLYLVKYYKPADVDPSPDLPKDGQVIAASLFFDYQGTRYYMQSAADDDYRKLRATAALLITAILDAKEQGSKVFDFWGIAPDDAPADHPWQGFTEFKKSFGGEPRHYAGTYDLVLKPTRYKLYQKLRQFNRTIKH